MVRDPRALLWDARASGNAIERFLSGKVFDDYLADEMLRSAVERQFEILGEAISLKRRPTPSFNKCASAEASSSVCSAGFGDSLPNSSEHLLFSHLRCAIFWALRRVPNQRSGAREISKPFPELHRCSGHFVGVPMPLATATRISAFIDASQELKILSESFQKRRLHAPTVGRGPWPTSLIDHG